MKIAFISSSSGDAFGLERVLSLSAGELGRLGHSVGFLVGRHQGERGTEPFLELPRLENTYLLTSPFQVRERIGKALNWLQSFRPDLLHFTDLFDARLIRALSSQYPSVFTAHLVTPTCPASSRHAQIEGGVCNKPSGWQCLLHNKSYHCLDGFKNDLHRINVIANHVSRRSAFQKYMKRTLAISEYVKGCLVIDGWPASDIDIVYNPVCPKEGKKLSDIPRNLLVCSSRLVKLKGIDVLLRALGEMKEAEWTLWICGEGAERGALEEQTGQLGLRQRVVFKGRLSYHDIQDVYSSAALFIQPNTGPEGFGLSVAEAMFQGCPVIVSDVPALNELIDAGTSGWVFHAGDHQALASMIGKVLSMSQVRSRVAREGQEKIRRNFSMRRHMEQTLLAYERAINGAT